MRVAPEELERRASRGDVEAAARYAQWLIDSGQYVEYGGAPRQLGDGVRRAAWDAGRFHGIKILAADLRVFLEDFEDADGPSEPEDVDFDPPVLLVPAMDDTPDDVFRRQDGWVDPIWQASLVHSREGLDKSRVAVWAEAPSYNDGGQEEPGRIWVPANLNYSPGGRGGRR